MKDFRKLYVWGKAHEMALATYDATKRFPQDEVFGLRSQVRRSVTSIPSNIAEGCGRGTDGELRQFLQIAMGSASEFEYQLLLSRDLKYLNASTYESLMDNVVEVKKMLSSLIKKLSAKR